MSSEESYPKTINELIEADFFILDKRDNVSIGVYANDENGFTGITFYKTNIGWSLNPTKMGRGFINLQPERFDFTKDFMEAKNHSDQTKNI